MNKLSQLLYLDVSAIQWLPQKLGVTEGTWWLNVHVEQVKTLPCYLDMCVYGSKLRVTLSINWIGEGFKLPLLNLKSTKNYNSSFADLMTEE